MRYIWLFCVTCALLPLQSCIRRSITEPRSDILREAASQGTILPSIPEERALFFSHEEAQRERLLQFLKDRAQKGTVDRDYRIGPGDSIELNVFDVPELNITAQVRQSGFLSLPLVGAVKAAGLTENELHRDLTQRLMKYVRNPEISIFISEYGSQKVAVIGAVNEPGTYPLKKGANSILELISEAGGVTEKAGGVVNFIPAELSGIGGASDAAARAQLALASFESGEVRERAIEVYLEQVMGTYGGIPLEIPVRGGDMIVIPEAGTVNVEGEVEKRGNYALGSKMTLLGALAAAGGITYSANIEEVEVIRDIGQSRKAHLVLNLSDIMRGGERDTRLRDGDIVRVPSHAGRRLSEDTFRSISSLINFGVSGGMNLTP